VAEKGYVQSVKCIRGLRGNSCDFNPQGIMALVNKEIHNPFTLCSHYEGETVSQAGRIISIGIYI